jgi:hypothetical protein
MSEDLNGVEPLCIQLFKGYIKKVTTLAHRPPSPGARAIPHLFRTFQKKSTQTEEEGKET